MDIVDAQIHIGPDSFEPYLAAMNAIGISSVLIEEFWVRRPGQTPDLIEPGFALPNGAWRAICPVAQLASILHPSRFAYFFRLDRRDPDLGAVMRGVASSPGGKGFRLLAAWTLDEAQVFINGGYDELFDLAQDIGLPVCLFIPGYAEHLKRYLERYPRLQFVIDHCGMGMPSLPPGRPQHEVERSVSASYFSTVLDLAEYPNVALKISHAPLVFGGGAYPFEMAAKNLRSAVDKFGSQRILWASDHTVMPHLNWSELLNYILFSPDFSQEEKEWILGRSCRTIFNWPSEPNGA